MRKNLRPVSFEWSLNSKHMYLFINCVQNLVVTQDNESVFISKAKVSKFSFSTLPNFLSSWCAASLVI